MLRENKRMLDKAIRDVDRERMALQNQEKKLVTEIKKLAKQNQMDAVRVLAKSLVRNRHAVTKLYQLKSQLQAVSLRIQVAVIVTHSRLVPMLTINDQSQQTLKSTQAMADAMRGATKVCIALTCKDVITTHRPYRPWRQ